MIDKFITAFLIHHFTNEFSRYSKPPKFTGVSFGGYSIEGSVIWITNVVVIGYQTDWNKEVVDKNVPRENCRFNTLELFAFIYSKLEDN